MPEGIVIRALSGFFDVIGDDGERRCRARGVFRKRGITVLVGDRVMYTPIGLHEGVVTEVLPRTSELVRPPVSNVDVAVLIFSLQSPAFHTNLLDKALVAVQAAGISPVIVVTKADLGSEEELARAVNPYKQAEFTVIPISVKTEAGIDAVRTALSGHVAVFVGPSGAGKSSLGNALSPELGLKMGEVSEKLDRGRHTTRHVELFAIGRNTYVVDAPGFSQLELTVSSSQLRDYFPEFRLYTADCAYRGCSHTDEQECGVRRAVEGGFIADSRFENYRMLYEEIRHKEETRY